MGGQPQSAGKTDHLLILAQLFRVLGVLSLLAVPMDVYQLRSPLAPAVGMNGVLAALGGSILTFCSGVALFLYAILLPVCAWGLERHQQTARWAAAILCALAVPPTLFGCLIFAGQAWVLIPAALLGAWSYGMWATIRG